MRLREFSISSKALFSSSNVHIIPVQSVSPWLSNINIDIQKSRNRGGIHYIGTCACDRYNYYCYGSASLLYNMFVYDICTPSVVVYTDYSVPTGKVKSLASSNPDHTSGGDVFPGNLFQPSDGTYYRSWSNSIITINFGKNVDSPEERSELDTVLYSRAVLCRWEYYA